MRPTPFQAYLRIQIGCDKFCTYCVVPNTRGPERGRSPEQIVSEARTLAEQGERRSLCLVKLSTVTSFAMKMELTPTWQPYSRIFTK